MTQSEIRDEIFALLDDIDTEIGADLRDTTSNFNFRDTISHLFFIRVVEIYQGILTLFKTDQVIAATVLVRSLSEAFILLKASMRDEDFNDRHIKNAALNKGKWIKKAIKHLPESGFGEDESYFEEMKAETHKLQEGLEKCLEDTYSLFEKHGELPIYLQIYTPASLYVHGNRQSFHVYHGPNDTVKSIAERDYSGQYRHAGFSAALLMFKSYGLFCELLKKSENALTKIEARMERSRKKIQKDMEE